MILKPFHARIDETVLKEFKKACLEEDMPMRLVIEALMKRYIKEKKEKRK